MPKYNLPIENLVLKAASLGEGESYTTELEETPTSHFRKQFREHLTRKGFSGSIALIEDGKTITLYRKTKSYTKKLEDMVRKLMYETENEALFDEAMALLEVK